MLTEPGALLRRVFRDFDAWSEPRFPLAGLRARTLADVPWMPPLEMSERDHRLVVTLELPGLKKEDIAVNLTDEGLVIEGERTHDVAKSNDEWFTTERTYGRFYRVVPLPEGVDFKGGTSDVQERRARDLGSHTGCGRESGVQGAG
jgi:HSP20 family protein